MVHAVCRPRPRQRAHQRFPLFEVQRRLDIALDVAFNYANFHTAAGAVRSLDVDLLSVDVHEDTSFTLLVNVLRNPLDGSATLRIDGNPALYTLTNSIRSAIPSRPAPRHHHRAHRTRCIPHPPIHPEPARHPPPPATVVDLFATCADPIPRRDRV